MRSERRWVFEGVGDAAYPELQHPTELSGPSAGQSALIHAIDIYLGVDHYSPAPSASSSSSSAGLSTSTGSAPSHPTFLARMQSYMPRHHRAFLRHLAANPRPLRALVEHETGVSAGIDGAGDDGLKAGRNSDVLEGYNAAVRALRTFRDAHLRIVVMYIVGPSRRVDAGGRVLVGARSSEPVGDIVAGTSENAGETEGRMLKGTGGTNLMPFLKGVRDRTAEAELNVESGQREGAMSVELHRER